MEKLNFKLNIKKVTWYDSVKMVADRMNEPVTKWLGRFKGWDQKDIDAVYRSAEALSKDQGLSFGRSLNWHLKEILK